MMTEQDLLNQSIARCDKWIAAIQKRLNALQVLYGIPDHVLAEIKSCLVSIDNWSEHKQEMQQKLTELQESEVSNV